SSLDTNQYLYYFPLTTARASRILPRTAPGLSKSSGGQRDLHAEGGMTGNRAQVLVLALRQGDVERARLAGADHERLLAGDDEVVRDLADVLDHEVDGPGLDRFRHQDRLELLDPLPLYLD